MISCITGKIRVGKTSFMTATAILNALDRAKSAERRRAVSVLKRQGYAVSAADFALYSNYPVAYRERDIVLNSIKIDPRRLSIAGGQYLRPHSTLAISEAQTYFNARAFQSFTPEQARFFQTSGHFGIDIYLDTQDIETVDKVIRGLCDVYEIQSRTIYDNAGRKVERAEPRNVSRIVFNYLYFSDVSAKPRSESLSIPFNVFECYDPFACYYDYLPADKKGSII